jgi:hypothetical protein
MTKFDVPMIFNNIFVTAGDAPNRSSMNRTDAEIRADAETHFGGVILAISANIIANWV